jgi:5-methyltetrahydrofolate--homocysteine methyltransferase
VIEVLREGLKIVGDNYQNGTYFLSELYLASETMNRALNTLKPHLNPKEGDTSTGKAVIGSIQGDIHDFGKTIIASLLNAAGVEIYDIGIDVPPEKFVSEALRVDASIIGISALLSTTQPLSKEVVDILKDKGVRGKFKVILGGSGVAPAVAVERFGVDAAVNDGAEGIEIILSWIRRSSEV